MNDLQRAQQCAEKMYANDRASNALGIDIEILNVGEATASMHVRKDMLNGFDICHGGIIFALADTAFAFACNAYDDLTVAGGGDIEFLRPAVRGDQLRATATEEHRGRRRGIYRVEVRNQDEQLLALFHGQSVSRGEAILGDN